MIIDSPIISGSYAASGSLNQVGNITITGSLTVTGPIIGAITGSADSASFATTASFANNAQNAVTASYLSNYIPPFPYTGSAGISGSLTVNGPITAQTLVVQTITSSVDFVTGSTHFGTIIDNTHQFTGSVSISGSLAVNGSNAILTNQTSSMSVATASYWSGSILNATSASFASTASYWSGSITNVLSASYALTASYASNVPLTASFADNATSASYALTASYWSGSIVNAATASFVTLAQSASYWSGSITNAATASFVTTAQTASFVQNAQSASYWSGSITNATSASYALTASYISGSGGGVGFPFSGSAVITGSLLITELSGSGTKYVITDNNGLLSISSGSTAIKVTETITSTTNQTSFTVPNGYTTGLVDVFINGIKLNDSEFTDSDGVTITLATGSNNGDIVEFAKYQPANGVTNNALRQQTIFTASAGQTVFSASYTPGLIDIFYNGSKLNSGDYTANNGTYFTLATASAADDILDVFVYSYQVGAFSGIGGTGTATQVAYFDTTNSITGSPNFTISGSTMTVTGSLTVSGSGTFTNIGPAVFSGSITSTQGFTGSFSGTATNATSASYAASATSASYAIIATTASYADALTVAGTLTAQTLVVQTITSSVDFVTGSTQFGSILGNTHQFTGSVGITGSSLSLIGNLGVGINNPTDNLHVQNDEGYLTLLYKASGSDTIISSNYHTYDGFDIRYGYETNISSYEYNNIFYQPASGYFGRSGSSTYFMKFESGYPSASLQRTVFQLNGNNKLTLLESGEVVIGKEEYSSITQTNWFPAIIRGPQASSTYSDIAGGNLTIQGGRSRGTGAGGDILFKTSNSGNESSSTLNTALTRMIIKGSGGNIGIANDSPQHKLSVGGSGQFSGNVYVGSGYRVEFVDQGTTSYSWIEGSSYDRAYSFLAFATSGSEKMRITSDGNVGIGTTNPTVKLYISGSSSRMAEIKTSGALSSGYYDAFQILAPNQTGGGLSLNIGKAESTNNLAKMVYFHSSDGSSSNRLGFGFYANDSLFNILASGTVQPGGNGTQDLGSTTNRWATIFTSDLSMSNGIGDYTIVEGEEDLFLYNNKTNKVFKFMLAEVDPSIAPPKKS